MLPNDSPQVNNEYERLAEISAVCDLVKMEGFVKVCGFLEDYVRQAEVQLHNSKSTNSKVSHTLLLRWQERSRMAIAFQQYVDSCISEKESLKPETTSDSAEFLQ